VFNSIVSGGAIVKILMFVLATLSVLHPMSVRAQSADALSEDQRVAIKRAQVQAEQTAAPVALRLAGVVKRIYANNLADAPDLALTTALDAEMKDLVWQLLLVKGESMWAAVRVLTPEQRGAIRAQVATATLGTDLPDLMDVITRTFTLTDKT
jgi:hypothetical protein